MRKKLLLLMCLFICGISYLSSQIRFEDLTEEQIYRKGNKYNIWSITVGGGPVIYYTDVVDYTFFPSHNWKGGPHINVAYQFGRCVALDVNFLATKMYGQKYKRYFEGDLGEFTLNATAYVNQLIANGPLRDKWNLYAKIGIGAVFFRSQMKALENMTGWDGRQISAHEILQKEDIFNIPFGYPTNYSDWKNDDLLVMGYSRRTGEKEKRETSLLIPIGAGVRYRINKSFDLGFELTLRNLTNDNLDVDMTGADNDSYMFSALSVTYKIGKKDKRHASWTYKDFNLDYNRDRGKDALADKLDSLTKRLEYLAANDSIVNDTTLITNTRIVRKEIFTVSVFFDFDKSTIMEMSQRTILNVARYMNEHPDTRMLIQGHCDYRGNYEYNEKLSLRRCNAVKDELVNIYGIDPARLEIDPRGKRELLSDTTKLPDGVHLVNRRVDIIPIITE